MFDLQCYDIRVEFRIFAKNQTYVFCFDQYVLFLKDEY